MFGNAAARAIASPRWVGRLGVVAVVVWLQLGAATLALEVSGFLELVAASVDQENVPVGGSTMGQQTDSFQQSYQLTLNHRVLPNLTLLAGGFFQQTDTTLEIPRGFLLRSDTTLKSLRPFAKILLNSELYRGQLSYSRVDDRIDPGSGLRQRQIREIMSGYFAWMPDDYPQTEVRLTRTDNHDRARAVVDRVRDEFSVTSRYEPIDPLLVRYRGTVTRQRDRLNRNEVDTESHNLHVIYGDTLWDDRLTLGADYNGTTRRNDTTTSGTGEVTFPLFPFDGLTAIDDSPEQGALASNPALVDSETSLGAGINIGLPPPGGDEDPRNIGLDFGVEVEANTLLVWVDRDLPVEVSSSFSWDIYTSVDNIDWTLRETVMSAPFGGAFQTRFELRFTEVTTRYLKVVIAPLSPTVQLATNFPDIFVSELQATSRVPADQAERSVRQAVQLFNANMRLQVTDSPMLYWEVDSNITDTDDATTWLVSNGLSLSHSFNERHSVSARLTREGGETLQGVRKATLLSAAFNMRSLEKLRNRVIISAREERDGPFSRDRYSILFYSILEFYRGVDLNVGVGRTYSRVGDNDTRDGSLLNAILRLSPHRKLRINLIFRNNTDDFTRGLTLTNFETDKRVWETSIAYTPLPSLYFFGSYLEDRRTGEEPRNIRNFNASWTPFPQGALRVNLNYNESYQSVTDSQTRNFIPSVRWAVTRRSYLEVAYQRLKTKSTLLKTENTGVFATLRLSF